MKFSWDLFILFITLTSFLLKIIFTKFRLVKLCLNNFKFIFFRSLILFFLFNFFLLFFFFYQQLRVLFFYLLFQSLISLYFRSYFSELNFIWLNTHMQNLFLLLKLLISYRIFLNLGYLAFSIRIILIHHQMQASQLCF